MIKVKNTVRLLIKYLHPDVKEDLLKLNINKAPSHTQYFKDLVSIKRNLQKLFGEIEFYNLFKKEAS